MLIGMSAAHSCPRAKSAGNCKFKPSEKLSEREQDIEEAHEMRREEQHGANNLKPVTEPEPLVNRGWDFPANANPWRKQSRRKPKRNAQPCPQSPKSLKSL
ncbi:hypothetical protein FACS1894158_16920 [Betaproteobacteria bacterium]|nr:hypothetical protein FACS1894158_16920 [Betaproteobacteria bacterium]